MPNPAPHILVIDDDPDTVTLIKMVLQKAGYRVTTGTEWEEVLDKLRQSQEKGDTIDLAILDIMMPGRSGFDVFIVLQAVLHPVPPVIFLSAKVAMEDMVRASELGAAKYLTKPTTPEKLRQTVAEVLNSRIRR